jgi:hypothetical protein
MRVHLRIHPLTAAAALVAMSLSGCTKIGLLYEYADKLVLYGIEDNFDLDKTQRARLKQEVEGYFQWHRKTLLPAYADFLAFAADSARDGLRPDEIDSGYNRYRELYRRTLEPVAEKSTAFLLGLTPGEIDAWLERQRKKNLKLRKQYSGSPQERLDHRAKKIVDELEDWTGTLSKEQKGKIKVLNAAVPWNGALWLDLREHSQERIADMAKRKVPADSLRAYLAAYYTGDESLKSEEFKARYREFERGLKGLIYAIHNLLTDDQKARFIQQVEKLAQDLRTRSQPD